MLIVFAGLPGVGKTTLAKLLSKRRRAAYVRIDTIEQAMLRSSLNLSCVNEAGYEIAYHLAKDNLLLGQDVIADSVNPLQTTREAWQSIAHECNAHLIQFEVICSDLTEHRRRIETRQADIQNHMMPKW